MFVTEGPLHPESHLFVGRSAELTQMEAWLMNVRCVGAVLGARQTGKTSLLLRLRHVFREKYAFVFIDLEAVAGSDLADCLTYIASEMISQLREQLERDDFALPTKTNDFLGFLEGCAQAVKTVRIVVLLDEIGALAHETSMRLTSAIRAVFTSRHVKPAFGRYVFVIAGATDALDVAVGRNSPLKNVAETLYLGDLSKTETAELVGKMFHDSAPESGPQLGQALHDWTNGHPYWTQRLGELLHQQSIPATEQVVTRAVEQLLHTEDRNLPHVFHALDADKTLRDLTAAMIAGTPIAFTRANSAIARLELLGLLRNDRGRCAIRNRIYREALDRDPLRRQLTPARDLREFSELLSTSTDTTGLFQTATLALQSMVQSRSAAALVSSPGRRAFDVVATIGAVAPPVEACPFTPSAAAVSALHDCTEVSQSHLSPEDEIWLRRLDATLLIPIRVGDNVVALFCLGPKLSGEDYDSDECNFIESLAQHAAGALERLRLRSLESDIKKAWRIQRELLPSVLPTVAGMQIAGSCQPARVVSGDYYDAFMLSASVMAICVGDVVGKGMAAALLMANLQGTLKILAGDTTAPSRLCELLNRAVARTVSPGEFITFFYAVIETDSRTVRFTNCGHNYPILARANGDVVRLETGGPVLGIFPDASYGEGAVTLGAGDRLVLFTDGVTEARNTARDEFGDERLIAAICLCRNDANTLVQAISSELEAFTGGTYHDDVTILVVTSDAS
jgi:serine phosphatase RsbU (regulator of sigma subunit)